MGVAGSTLIVDASLDEYHEGRSARNKISVGFSSMIQKRSTSKSSFDPSLLLGVFAVSASAASREACFCSISFKNVTFVLPIAAQSGCWLLTWLACFRLRLLLDNRFSPSRNAGEGPGGRPSVLSVPIGSAFPSPALTECRAPPPPPLLLLSPKRMASASCRLFALAR